MSEITGYKKTRNVILNKAKDYYKNKKERLKKQARDKYRSLSEEDKNKRREYGKNRNPNMSEEILWKEKEKYSEVLFKKQRSYKRKVKRVL